MRMICSWTRQQKKRPKIKQLESLALTAAREAGLPDSTHISIVFLPDVRMAELNEDALNHHGPTDVICFDLRSSEIPGLENIPDGNAEEEIADDIEIYVCPDVAAREAEKRNLPYPDEVILYLVHGLLHASGEDDLVPEKKRIMRRRERQVMTALRKQYDFERIFAGASPVSL